MAATRISELASLIAINTTNLDAHLTSEGLPTPSFDADAPARLLFDDKIASSRQAILEATDELQALVLGPIGILTSPSVRITAILSVVEHEFCRYPSD